MLECAKSSCQAWTSLHEESWLLIGWLKKSNRPKEHEKACGVGLVAAGATFKREAEKCRVPLTLLGSIRVTTAYLSSPSPTE